ncbi:MAG: HlyD family secretion protein [Planctomycetaceae bacterium]
MLMANPQPVTQYSAMQLVRSSKRLRVFAGWLLMGMVLVMLSMLLLPWQQTAKGTGRVVAYFPMERPQTVESPIYGRVARWGENIVEGAHVKKGDLILEIRDNDPTRSQRLADQMENTKEKMRLSKTKAETYGRQVEDLTAAKQMLIQAGEELIEAAKQKIAAEEQGLRAARAGEVQTKANYERQKALRELGIQAGKELEQELRKYEEAQAKVLAAQAYVDEAKNNLKAKKHELEQKSREAETKIDYARAMQQEALGDVQLASKDLLDIEGKAAQFESRKVLAPRDGIIFKLFVSDNAEMLKEGDSLFTIVPEINDHAVELLVDGNDIPLVEIGSEVRLQFHGFPAVQFVSGWPKVSRGTFGATVVSIDATDTKGKFRILVRPPSPTDPWGKDEKWPDERFLRQGVRVNGWVMLKQVSLGYEIWRQLNGFPPDFDANDDGKSDDKSEGKGTKKVKLPK